MSPVAKGFYYGIKLLVISGVPLLCLVQLFTKECNRMSFLAKNTSNTHLRSVTSNLEHFGEVRQTKDWCFRYFFLYFFKCLACCLRPSKLAFLHAISYRGHYRKETSEKSPVKSSQAMETTNFMQVSRYRPFQDSFHLLRINFHAFRGDKKAKKYNARTHERALLPVNVELFATKNSHYLFVGGRAWY